MSEGTSRDVGGDEGEDGATTAGEDPPPTTADAEVTELVDLRDPAQAEAWTTVNDPVMGGRSSSTLTLLDEGLEFSGVVSLENNGGFASVRGPDDAGLGGRAGGASSLGVTARGDGQTYVLQVRVGAQQHSYVHRFTTEAGELRRYELPVEGFEAVNFFLEPAPGAPPRLDLTAAVGFTVYILDKQEGPFSLTLAGIDARA